jgi:hypothetical protein
MPPPRPASYTTFAVLNFIVGGFALLCSVCSGIDPTVDVNHQNVTPQMVASLNQQIPGYTTYKITGMVIGLLIGAGLITAGVGLLVGPVWGRIAALAVSGVGLLHHVALAIFQFFFVGPAMTRFFAGMGPFGGLFSTMPQFLIFIAVLWEGMIAIYYLVQLLVLAFVPPRVVRPRDAWDEDDRPRRRLRRDWDDDEPPRRRRREEWD